jgi:uncharacterized protein
MDDVIARTALIVRGGWDGHQPQVCTDLFTDDLAAAGYKVTISETLEVYDDAALLRRTGLIVQCWTGGELTPSQSRTLTGAVEAGTGFAGWHGGIVAAFPDRDYQRMTGGAFLHHPADFTTYAVQISPEHRDHPIMAGLDDFTIETEQYWMLTDALNTTLATTACPLPGGASVVMPVVWTRAWGAGKVFVSALGHRPEDLRHPAVRALTLRGLLWAGR